jgi:isoamylase
MFAGSMDKLPYLEDLGVTAIELMPVAQQDPQEDSRWGYMPLALFAPQKSYASSKEMSGVMSEFHAMVDSFHAARIEVLLDVVYNHTTEGDEFGPSYSFREIYNTTYYLLEPD